jgi:hypothetical protein
MLKKKIYVFILLLVIGIIPVYTFIGYQLRGLQEKENSRILHQKLMNEVSKYECHKRDDVLIDKLEEK